MSRTKIQNAHIHNSPTLCSGVGVKGFSAALPVPFIATLSHPNSSLLHVFCSHAGQCVRLRRLRQVRGIQRFDGLI